MTEGNSDVDDKKEEDPRASATTTAKTSPPQPPPPHDPAVVREVPGGTTATVSGSNSYTATVAPRVDPPSLPPEEAALTAVAAAAAAAAPTPATAQEEPPEGPALTASIAAAAAAPPAAAPPAAAVGETSAVESLLTRSPSGSSEEERLGKGVLPGPSEVEPPSSSKISPVPPPTAGRSRRRTSPLALQPHMARPPHSSSGGGGGSGSGVRRFGSGPGSSERAKNGLTSLFDPPPPPPPPSSPGPSTRPSHLRIPYVVDNKEEDEKKKLIAQTTTTGNIVGIDDYGGGGGGGGSVAFQQAKSHSLDNDNTSVSGSDDDDGPGGPGGKTKKNKNRHSSSNCCFLDRSCWFFGFTTTPRCLRRRIPLPADILAGPTIAGAFMFLLYHVVFALALASALTRPTQSQQQGSSSNILGHMAKQTAVGIFVSCPFMISRLGNPDIPALYPSVDLFLAPFLAEAASIVDYQLCEEYKQSHPTTTTTTTTTGSAIVMRPDDDEEDGTTAPDDAGVDNNDDEGGVGECPYSKELFFGSFGVLTSIGMSLAGLALKVASLPNMKLANLGSYLPFSVLCGFFSAVGVLMWTLAFNVDSGGHSWQQIFFSSSSNFTIQQKWDAVVHHVPSLIVGILMNRLGPKNPFYVVGLIVMTIIVFYVTMALSGTSLEQAQDEGWFWSYNELATSNVSPTVSTTSSFPLSTSWMLPPTPFGTWVSLLEGYVSWTAVFAGVKNMAALAFLYLLRSSIHASALKKNVSNLVRRIPVRRKSRSVALADKGSSKLRDRVNPILNSVGHLEAKVDESTSLLLEGGGRPRPTLDEEYEDDDDDDDNYSFEGGSVRRASNAAYRAASKMVTSVRDAVSIVNLSMKDDHELSPSKNCKATLQTLEPGATAQPGRRSQVSINSFGTDVTTQRGYSTLTTPPRGGSTTRPISDGSSVTGGGMGDEKREETERGTNLTHNHEIIDDDDDGILVPEVVSTNDLATGDNGDNNRENYIEIRPPPSKRSLEDIFVEYGNSLWVVAAVGGFGCCPTVATSTTMYAIGAGSTTPQYGSVALLLIFYFTNFEIVRFIPKTAFSSLLVLGAVDTIVVWFYGPLKKTSSWAEWSVVPLIVAASLVVGFLNAVFVGIGISMFVFVGQFFTVGTVKYQATGLEIRSRIERSLIQSLWLDTNGDWIQVVVLQSYLFFGNATSLQQYISTMFDESFDVITETQRLQFEIPPVPRVLVIDLSLVTGMDTSSVDSFDTIRQLCKSHHCKLHLCGLSPRMKKTLRLGGVVPDKKRRQRGPRGRGPSSDANGDDDEHILLFFQDLDSGLGKAEDYLIECEMPSSDAIQEISSSTQPHQPFGTTGSSTRGFDKALQKIDELHGTAFSSKLKNLEHYAKLVKMKSGDFLYDKDGHGGGSGAVHSDDRGLFFIECGLLSIQHDSNDTTFGRSRTYMNSGSVDYHRHMNSLTNRHRYRSNTNTNRNNSTSARSTQTIENHKLLNYNMDTLKGQHARLGTIAKRAALVKRLGGGGGGGGGFGSYNQNFRYARVGAGWVLGTYEISRHQSVEQSENRQQQQEEHYHHHGRGEVVKCIQDGTTLYHVPFRTLQELETTNPVLIVNLYKLLACVMAKKEDSWQDQISTYHNIMAGNI